jgi:hypothetical protein
MSMYTKSKTANEFVNYESNVYQLKESPSLSTKSMCIKWKRQAPFLNEKLQVQSSKFEAPVWITRSDLQKSSLFTQIITKANTHISYIKYHQQKTKLPSMFHLLPNQQHALNQQPNWLLLGNYGNGWKHSQK